MLRHKEVDEPLHGLPHLQVSYRVSTLHERPSISMGSAKQSVVNLLV